MSDIAAPFDAYRDVVRPDWIDHNRHMNMGYDALPRPPQVGRAIGLAARPATR